MNIMFIIILYYTLTPILYNRADSFTIKLINTDTGDVIYDPVLDRTGDSGQVEWQLTEGNYRLEVIVDPRLANMVDVELNLNGTVTSLDNFQVEANNHEPEEGNLLDNDGVTQFGHIEVNGKPLDIIEDNTFDNNPQESITVEGKHGTLTVHQDGSYTYKANGSSYGIDEFDYKLISINGTSESAKLSI